MIKPIVTNIKDLKKPCEEVQKEENISELVQDLKDTLYQLGRGYGLAANQIGVQKKVCFVKFPKKEGGVTEMVFINPKIIEKQDKFVCEQEGCLSFQSIRMNTDRYIYVGVTYLDENFEEKTVMAQDLESLILQHEIDHLEGRTIFDRKHKAK